MSSEIQEILSAVKRMADALESLASSRKGQGLNQVGDNVRKALVFSAIQNGATSFVDVARELGVHPSTAGRCPIVRRAIEKLKKEALAQRQVTKEEGEDFRWQA